MKVDATEVEINGVTYVPKSSVSQPARNTEGKDYCIVRTFSAGVFAGYLDTRNGKEAKVLNARRLWKWDGAASLSELAVRGVSKPDGCKFPCEVPMVLLTEVIEVIPATEDARKSIASVKEWSHA